MTWSCRSAAIRSRSSSIAARLCSERASASSMATEAWAANPAAMSTSSAVNAGLPVRLAAVSTPNVPCDPVSGTTIIGPTSSSPVLAGDVPSSSCGVATRSGSPVVNTRPDSEPAIGTRGCPATAGALFPTAISTRQVPDCPGAGARP